LLTLPRSARSPIRHARRYANFNDRTWICFAKFSNRLPTFGRFIFFLTKDDALFRENLHRDAFCRAAPFLEEHGVHGRIRSVLLQRPPLLAKLTGHYRVSPPPEAKVPVLPSSRTQAIPRINPLEAPLRGGRALLRPRLGSPFCSFRGEGIVLVPNCGPDLTKWFSLPSSLYFS